MKRIVAIVLAGWPLSVSAHPCPFDWNIEFSEAGKVSGKNIKGFADHFNEAVSKQTKGKVPKAIIYAVRPDSFTKVPVGSPFAKEMDALIQRYSEVTAPLIEKGVFEYGGAPRDIEFPANFPVACIISSPNVGVGKRLLASSGQYLKIVPMKTTAYFREMRNRPDRAVIRDEWILRTMGVPDAEEVQDDGRIRRWKRIFEMDNRALRVILLEDGETVHNAFFDRGFQHDEG